MIDAVTIPAWFWGLAALSLCLIVTPGLDRGNPLHRKIVSGAGIAATMVYMGWRLVATIDTRDRWSATLSVVFLLLEAVSVAGSLVVLVVLTRHRDRRPDVAANLPWLWRQRPSAAVFIATYNEGVPILERTITGALSQNYPCKVYVLDDGRRPEIEQLCRRRGVEWLTRPNNLHAKAGNMNAGLATLRSRGQTPDFIAVLDADFVALPEFVERALSLFRDPHIGVVQTPQVFFNPDPLQHRIKAHLELPDEQRFFFDALLPAKDGWGTAQSCGTSSIVRTSTLEAIGGFPTESVTEDMLLSFRMKRRGFITAYLHETLSLGLAPEGVGEYCTQRVRWCVGAMQIVRGKDGLLARNGLGFLDRLSMMETVLYWAGSFPFRIACLLMPVLYWYTGISPMHASVDSLTRFLLPRMIIESFAIAWYSTGRIMPLMTDVSQLLIAPEIIAASIHTLLFPGERPFKVTPKGGDRSRTVIHWRIFWRFGTILILTLAGMLASYWLPLTPTFFFENKGVVAFWSVYNTLVCVIGIIVSIETPRRGEERISIKGQSIFHRTGALDNNARPVTLIDISANGIAFANDGGFASGDSGTLLIPRIGSVEAEITRVTPRIVGARIKLSSEQLVQLTRFQFADRQIRMPQIGLGTGLFALFRGLAGR